MSLLQQLLVREGVQTLTRYCRIALAAVAAPLNNAYSCHCVHAQVLGVEPGSDNNTINRAYRVKRYEARGNDELTAQIEAAHSQLMFSSLNERLKVGTSA
jgi:hypothetical protein